MKIGLALGGGGARGSAHIGVLMELERLRIRPVSHHGYQYWWIGWRLLRCRAVCDRDNSRLPKDQYQQIVCAARQPSRPDG